jgi:CheY-like chemotaxis protein
MDGVETTKRIRDMGYKGPIVALTANAVTGQSDMFLKNGFDDFISKPIDLRQMNIVLNKFIRDKQSAEVIEATRQGALAEKANGQSKKSIASVTITDLDVGKGIERYNGDEKIYLDILRSYARSTRSTLGLIETETITEENITDYKIRVHGIKGASYDIFAEKIGKEAEVLEYAANDVNLSLIRERNPAFLTAAEKLLDNIDAALASVDDKSSKPKRDKPESELLSKLLTACNVYDMDGADTAMTEIEEYQYTADDGLAAWLRENIDMTNFGQIAERLSGYFEGEGAT